jgi:hypothetical protein
VKDTQLSDPFLTHFLPFRYVAYPMKSTNYHKQYTRMRRKSNKKGSLFSIFSAC